MIKCKQCERISNCPYGIQDCESIISTCDEFSFDLAEHDKQIREDERKRILGTVDFKQSDNPIRREVDFSISFDSMLNPEEVVSIMLKQIREQLKGAEE